MMIEYITNQGYTLLSRMLTGECKINFTRVEMGNGTPTEQDLKRVTALARTVCSIDVESIKVETDNTVDVTATFTNAEIDSAFYFKEKGVFASDGNREILFSYGYTTDPELIPAHSEAFMEKRLKTIVKQLQNVSAPINIEVKSGIYVSLEDYNKDKKKYDEELMNTNDKLSSLSDKVILATKSNDGLMSKSDYSKLSGVEAGANKYVHPGNGTNPHGTTKSDVGLGSVDNTSDMDKPVSTAQQEKFDELKDNLSQLEYSDVAVGKNLIKYNNISGTLSKTVKCSLDTGTYTISTLVNSSDTDASSSLIIFDYENGEGYYCRIERDVRTSYTVTLTERVISLTFYASNNWTNSQGDTFTYSDIQIEKGSTATDYEPYIPSVKMLADKSTQIDDLKVLGWVVPEEMPIKNYVDNDGVFHQRVGRVDLGSLDWHGSGTSFFYTQPNQKALGNNIYCSLYNNIGNVSDSEITASDNMSIGTEVNADFVKIKNTSYEVTTTFKNAMQGVYLYYELAEEILIKVDGNEAVYNLQNDCKTDISHMANIGALTQNEGRYGAEIVNVKKGTYNIDFYSDGGNTYVGYKRNGKIYNPEALLGEGRKECILYLEDGDSLILWHDVGVSKSYISSLSVLTSAYIGYEVDELKQDLADNYLNKTDASNTYAAKEHSHSDYLSKTDAGNTYLSKTDASNTYATKEHIHKDTITNLLNFNIETQTSNGITITNNGDGTYILSGTASASAEFSIPIDAIELQPQRYIILLGLPYDNCGVNISIEYENASGWIIKKGTADKSGLVFRVSNGSTATTIILTIEEGRTYDNLVIKPMLSYETRATYEDFVPFTGTTGNINSDIAELRRIVESLK